jgi:hypothetical protein
MPIVDTAQDTGSFSTEAWEHSEGPVARRIEEETAKLPSDTFLWAALGSMGVALLLQMSGKRHASLFVGQWAAPFLLFGVYNKLVKVGGSDRLQG